MIEYRKQIFEKAIKTEYDIIIIGGGVTGAGIALDAATRGLKTLLLEKQDFAAGTSSRSSKLIHGGLRYLKQFEIGIVGEVGKERAVLYKNAPHLVIPEKMLLPIIKNGSYGKLLTRLGLWIYDLLANVLPKEQKMMLSKQQVLKVEPLLREDILIGGGLYTEYRTDDARLTLEIIKTASEKGADCINYAEVTSFIKEKGILKGVICYDKVAKEEYHFKAKKNINATGPWVDVLRFKDGKMSKKKLHLTKGIHIVLPFNKLPLNQSVYFDTHDKRMIFAIPVGQKTYVGTTDTNYSNNLEAPSIKADEVEYLVKAINNMFPQTNIQISDVETAWAGLRPLIHQEGKAPSELSRKDEIFVSDSGLISIAGGKLTGYRKMAERIVNLVMKKLAKEYNFKFKYAVTDEVRLAGADGLDATNISAFINAIFKKISPLGLSETHADYLVRHYGINSENIVTNLLSFSENEPKERLIRAELKYCLENEYVIHLEDFIIRRTSRIYFDLPFIKKILPYLIKDLQAYFNLDDNQMKEEEERVKRAIEIATVFR